MAAAFNGLVSGRPRGCVYRRTDTSWPRKLRILIIDAIRELTSARGKALLGSSGKHGEAEIGETRFTSLLAVYEKDVALVGAKRTRRCHGRDYREVIAGGRVDPPRDHSSADRDRRHGAGSPWRGHCRRALDFGRG